MLYSVYSKWIISEDDKDNIDCHELPLFNNWVLVGSNLAPTEVMEILLTCEANVYADNYIQIVLPEINFGDIVMNIKNNKIGKVIYFDQNPIQRFDEIYTDEEGIPVEKIFEFVTVESEGEVLNWEMKDLIVIDDSTIY